MVVEPVEELELIETQQHLWGPGVQTIRLPFWGVRRLEATLYIYICLSCMRQGAASECSEWSSE